MDIDNAQGIGTDPQTERTYQKIARHLKQRIRAEGWSTGDRLPSERVLATDFGVSRTSLREALLALEIAGIVEIRVGSGVFILPHDNNVETASHSFLSGDPGPFEFLEVRRVIEGQAAYNAAFKGSNEHSEKLETIVNKLLATQFDDDEEFNYFDREFHMQVAESSGNTVLVQMVQWMWDIHKGPLWKVWYHDTRSSGNRARSLEDHKEIFNFIKNREADLARTAMTAHVDRVIQRFLKF